MRTFLIFILIWLIFSAVGYGSGSYVLDPAHLEYMTKESKGVYGQVVTKEPENHATVRYTYSVAGVEYTGSGGAGADNPDFDQLQIGDHVIVYYDPAHPEESVSGNPWEDLGARYTGILFLTLAFPLFPMIFILAIYFVIRAAKKSRPSQV